MATVIACLAAAPALAQNAPKSDQLLNAFVMRCSEIAAAASAGNPGDIPTETGLAIQTLGGGVSGDGGVFFHSEQLEFPGSNFALLKFDAMILPSLTRTTCYLSLTGSSPDAYTSFAEVPSAAETRIGDFVGDDFVRVGGEVADAKDFRQAFRWISGLGTPTERELLVAEGFGTVRLTLTSNMPAN